MTQYLYDNHIGRLSGQFKEALDRIEVVENFDYGQEFEIAICQMLRQALPARFGVCRGHAVNRKGETAGDDVIIYDRLRFPTLRMLGPDAFGRKEKIPIEAVYAYIEAKHTLQLTGDGPASLKHASDQAAKVKLLCNQREQIGHGQIAPHFVIPEAKVAAPDDSPSIRNPMFTAVLSRFVKFRSSSKSVEDSDEVRELFEGGPPLEEAIGRTRGVAEPPDLIVAGPNYACLPFVERPEIDASVYVLPFFLPRRSLLIPKRVDGIAFGVGLSSILFALDWIVLGRMPHDEIIGDALGMITRK